MGVMTRSNIKCALHYHMGDDIAAYFERGLDAILYVISAKLCNLRGQVHKLLLHHTRCEFLRNMISHNGAIYGALNRCIGTLVSGNWETDVVDDPISRANAIWN